MISLRDVVTGFGNRDPLAEVWRRNLRGGGGGAAEITGVPPLRYIGDGRPLTDYLLSGNTVQDGTPSPDAPVDATGSGVRTGNLFSGEFSQFDNVGGTGDTYRYFYIPEDFILTLIAKDTHTIPDNIFLGITKDGGQPTDGVTWAIRQRKNVIEGDIFTVKSSTNGYHYVSMYQKLATTLSWVLEHYHVMLNLGSTALPYEPYGYKLPLTVNGVEYPIYLGQVETTRRIKKLAFDGTEAWNINTSAAAPNNIVYLVLGNVLTGIAPFCTHYEGTDENVWGRIQVNNITESIVSGGVARCAINIGDATLTDFKSYLAAQYAAGTPVTVWYVLAEPETGIVNEPLMKIGDYADTVSFAQARVTIPTVSGENVLDVPTDVKPSEVTIKGGISSV